MAVGAGEEVGLEDGLLLAGWDIRTYAPATPATTMTMTTMAAITIEIADLLFLMWLFMLIPRYTAKMSWIKLSAILRIIGLRRL